MAIATDTKKVTPMMAQWEECKKKAGSALLFFRMGDFYEAFYEDAEIICRELGLTLTKRQEIPMGGVPAGSVEGHLDKLLSKGYRIAVAEQTEDPATAKGLVRREVTRILSPGSLLDSALIKDEDLNLFVSISQVGKTFGIAFLDRSCSHFQTTELASFDEVETEVLKSSPKEVLISESLWRKHKETFSLWKERHNLLIHTYDDWRFEQPESFERLRKHFSVYTLDGFGLQGKNGSIEASGGLLAYFHDELAEPLRSIKKLSYYDPNGFLTIDKATETHLELFGHKHSLFALLDKTETPMGRRLLKEWLKRPLQDLVQIEDRQKSVEILLEKPSALLEIPKKLEKVRDIERLVVKVATGMANPRDLSALAHSLKAIPPLKAHLEALDLRPSLLSTAHHFLSPLEEAADRILTTLSDPPPAKLQDGHVIRPGVNEELDNYRSLGENAQEHLANYQTKLREQTGIKTLKLGFNRMFGYYIEVSRGQSDKVPDSFSRRQTLANGERFVTPELKEFETKVFASEEKVRQLEKDLYFQLVSSLNPFLDLLFANGKWMATIDTLTSLALVAYHGHYIKPLVDDSSTLSIKRGRHPVVETLQQHFIPNDTLLDGDSNQMKLITGPNMAGKSTYIRQVALMVVLAQMGSFVPAESAHVGLVDRLFSRIGANDDLGRGQSTFMVEMAETAYILHHATEKSLVVLDEIGRGTSTFDGISIAWAVAEYLLTEKGKRAKTLFATHYFELTDLEKQFPHVKNYHSAVEESGGNIKFLRKIVPGAADRSYGIHVAKLAGLPPSVITSAFETLKKLEGNEQHLSNERKQRPPTKPLKNDQLLLF